MITFAKPLRGKPFVKPQPPWHAGFMALLPDIRRHVRFAFRRLQPDRREEAMQESLANALVAYVRLYELGRTAVAYASPLASYAVRQVCCGRQVAGRLNSHEVLSTYSQRKHGFTVTRLQRADETERTWKEILVEDPSCTPAELAASRLDFDAWLRRLQRRKRRIALTLAAGETTCGTARKFRVTPGRVSQLRRELADNWDQFHGEVEQAGAAC